LILAALLAASPALAQEPPTTLSGFGQTRGVSETAGDIESYRIKLVQGKDYAIGTNTFSRAQL
jgi:hypothetical protein